jgi:LysM repeat protein
MGVQRQSSIRLLAPAALTLFAIVFLIVVVASLTGGDEESSTTSERPAAASERRSQRERDRNTPARSGNPRFYTVKPGDNLAAIAAETGVPLEELRSLNPELDPQGLVSGQRVRLRESGG